MEVPKNVYAQNVRVPKLSLQFMLGHCVDNFKHKLCFFSKVSCWNAFLFPDYILLLKAYLIFVTYIIF